MRLVPADEATRMRLEMEERMDDALRRDGSHISWIGAKPEMLQNTDGVVLYPIPNSSLSIRAFPGDFHPRERCYCFDIYDTKKGKPVKSRPNFKFTSYADGKRVTSVEAAWGIAWKDIKEEEERFIASDAFACRLERPGAPPFLFQLPALPQPAPFPGSCSLCRSRLGKASNCGNKVQVFMLYCDKVE
ncbi:hypothetical protein FB451DRAFT_598112 [Mycena latifolia]|nr:hypothetical protein FB451DRAFT_598112 [Mycena latifolia]